ICLFQQREGLLGADAAVACLGQDLLAVFVVDVPHPALPPQGAAGSLHPVGQQPGKVDALPVPDPPRCDGITLKAGGLSAGRVAVDGQQQVGVLAVGPLGPLGGVGGDVVTVPGGDGDVVGVGVQPGGQGLGGGGG